MDTPPQTTAIEEYAEKLVDESFQSIQDGSCQHDTCNGKPIEGYVDGIVRASLERCLADWRRKRTVFVGAVCLDLITVVDEYPVEDTKTPAVEHYCSRGGNASNNSSVLAHLGANVEFLGTIVLNKDAKLLLDDFKSCGVHTENCVFLDPAAHKAPTCPVIVSKKTGTRTALPDFKNVTRLSFSDFDKVDLDVYKWIHFEGSRLAEEIVKMLDKVNKYSKNKAACDKVITSIEIEQRALLSPQLYCLFNITDFVFVGKDFAAGEGFTSMEEAAAGLIKRCREGATIICPWGELGAAAKHGDEPTVVSPVFPPGEIVDTIGAGDTFNAATILALSNGLGLQEAVTFGCRVAGVKCGMKGFSGLKGLF